MPAFPRPIGMTCTRCFTPTDIEFDGTGLDVGSVLEICRHWKCPACFEELDRIAADQGITTEELMLREEVEA